MIEETSEVIKQINNQYWKGLITEDERYLQTIKIWSNTKSEITKIMINSE
jgi:DNA-directed RNA polymerase subunit beta'